MSDFNTNLLAFAALRAMQTDANGNPSTSTVTSTELGFVSGVTSSIQTQLNGKQASGNYITALTGDVTATGPGSVAATLATVNANVGSFGSSTSIPSFTVNAKGLITAASGNVVIAPAGTLTGATLAANVLASSLTSVGTITTGVWNGTTIAVANGGTSLTTLTANNVILGNGTSAPTFVAPGTSGNVLTSNGTTWVSSAPSASGVTTVGAFSASSQTNGASISGSTITFGPADGTNPGMIKATGAQTLGATLTLTNPLTISAASTTALVINTSSFIFDSTNNSLGVGKAPAASTFFDIQASTASAVICGIVTGYGANQIGYRTRYARGTSGSPTAAQSGDTLVFFNAQGYGATAFPAASTGSFNIVAAENFTDSAMGTYLRWFTTPTGSVTAAETMRLNSTGNLLIGTTTDNATDKLQVNGTAIATSMKVTGATSGTITLSAVAVAGTNTASFPAFTGTALISADNEIIMTGGNGFGSTNTAIRRFTTTQRNNGSAMTLANTAASGASITIVTPGLYSISYADGGVASQAYGLSINSAQLTTAIGSITAANRILSPYVSGGNDTNVAAVVIRLAANDVIRPHCTNNTASDTGADDVTFRMILIGAQ